MRRIIGLFSLAFAFGKRRAPIIFSLASEMNNLFFIFIFIPILAGILLALNMKGLQMRKVKPFCFNAKKGIEPSFYRHEWHVLTI